MVVQNLAATGVQRDLVGAVADQQMPRLAVSVEHMLAQTNAFYVEIRASRSNLLQEAVER